MIEISHIHKTFSEKGNRVEAVQDVSLHIAKGQIYGIIGNSGAGKSTLVRCLNLLEVPDSGEIRRGTKVNIGYYDQEHHVLTAVFFPDRGKEHLVLDIIVDHGLGQELVSGGIPRQAAQALLQEGGHLVHVEVDARDILHADIGKGIKDRLQPFVHFFRLPMHLFLPRGSVSGIRLCVSGG